MNILQASSVRIVKALIFPQERCFSLLVELPYAVRYLVQVVATPHRDKRAKSVLCLQTLFHPYNLSNWDIS